jgi:phosphotriesterase-related protein
VNRRDFLSVSASLAGAAWVRTRGTREDNGQIVTVAGAVEPQRAGMMLPHEHVLVDFIGADKATSSRYDADEVFQTVLPHLKKAKHLGCETLAECTPAYLGRDPTLLQRLSQASGLQLLTNTGYYGAVTGKYLPDHVRSETAEELAARWLREWHDGINDTGVRPGFIKIGVDGGPLSEINRKLVRAAARTHLKSGLTIAAHTGDGTAALDQLRILTDEGVHASAFIWVHAQSERDTAVHARAAEQGAWVEFDGIAPETVAQHVELLQAMKTRGYLERALVSHDAGWYHVGEPSGGKFRSYETLFSEFLPALKAAGFSNPEIRSLTVDNPRQAFTVRVRAGRAA